MTESHLTSVIFWFIYAMLPWEFTWDIYLWSTIIGDSLVNVLESAGHDVKQLNQHVGDRGDTPVWCVGRAFKRSNFQSAVQLRRLRRIYKAAKRAVRCRRGIKKARTREGVLKLQ